MKGEEEMGGAEGSTAFLMFELLSCVIGPYVDLSHCSELRH